MTAAWPSFARATHATSRRCGGCPGGGIDFGEAPEDTLVREFEEETGLAGRRTPLLGVTSDVRRRDNGDKIHTVRILFTVELAGGELRHEVHGTTDHAGWFDLADLDAIERRRLRARGDRRRSAEVAPGHLALEELARRVARQRLAGEGHARRDLEAREPRRAGARAARPR